MTTVPPLATGTALPGRLRDVNLIFEPLPVLSDCLGDRESLQAGGLGVLDCDPQTAAWSLRSICC